MSHPSSYKTLNGLLKATEKVLSDNHHNVRDRFDGMSHAMWLTNAAFIAESRFGDTTSVPELRKKWSISRPQDLKGGHAVFGIPLPTREYQVGDNIPGVGQVSEIYNDQFFIAGQWYHKRCFEPATSM